jgi:hypothetical protein
VRTAEPENRLTGLTFFSLKTGAVRRMGKLKQKEKEPRQFSEPDEKTDGSQKVRTAPH